jgi:branched-chain amino acid transport system ATP-binding protein
VLQVSGLDALYGRAQVLFGVGLQVGRGEAVALLGRNGAGKSTTLKSIMGLVPPAAGRVRFMDRELHGLPVHHIARMGLGYVPEDRRVFPDLTIAENLEVGRRAPRPGVPVWTPERLYELFPALAELRHRPAGRTSGGEQQMLTIARTLMGNPALLLLDEPSEGLAPVVVEQLTRALLTLKQAGVSLLLSEQNPGFARRIGDRLYLIEQGRIRHACDFAELDADPELRRNYLGV